MIRCIAAKISYDNIAFLCGAFLRMKLFDDACGFLGKEKKNVAFLWIVMLLDGAW